MGGEVGGCGDGVMLMQCGVIWRWRCLGSRWR